MLTVHRGTAGAALEHFQRYTSRFKSLEFRECRQRLLTGDLAGAFPRSLVFFNSCREAFPSPCSVSQQHLDSHSHTYTRSHLGAAEYNHTRLLSGLVGEAEGSEASGVHAPSAGFVAGGQLEQPTLPVSCSCKDRIKNKI